MKAEAKKTTNLLVGAMLLVAGLATAFWMLALSPKRDEATKLDAQVTQLEGSLAQHQSEIASAEEARSEFPVDYHRLVRARQGRSAERRNALAAGAGDPHLEERRRQVPVPDASKRIGRRRSRSADGIER